jgi:hypothetical protein
MGGGGWGRGSASGCFKNATQSSNAMLDIAFSKFKVSWIEFRDIFCIFLKLDLTNLIISMCTEY